MKGKRTRIICLALLALLGEGVLGQAARGQSRVTYSGDMSAWTPVDDVFAKNGTLRVEYKVPPTNYHSGEPVVDGSPEFVGKRIRRWMDKFAAKYGSAKELGFEDGENVDTRRFCLGDSVLPRNLLDVTWMPPSGFEEWVEVSEAIVDVRVTGVYPGFTGKGVPSSLLTLSVVGNLYPPEKPMPSTLQIVIPVAEFVAGDVVFCGYESWGGYYPKTGDRLLVGAFAPPGGDAGALLNLAVPGQVFVVNEDGRLERLYSSKHGDHSCETDRLAAREFPDTLMEFYSSVDELWAQGVTLSPSLHDRNTMNR